MNEEKNMDSFTQRRTVLAAGALLDPHKAAAQAASQSVLRTALGRGKFIVGSGSTNPPRNLSDQNMKLSPDTVWLASHQRCGGTTTSSTSTLASLLSNALVRWP
jgi:hypothetical protein